MPDIKSLGYGRLLVRDLYICHYGHVCTQARRTTEGPYCSWVVFFGSRRVRDKALPALGHCSSTIVKVTGAQARLSAIIALGGIPGAFEWLVTQLPTDYLKPVSIDDYFTTALQEHLRSSALDRDTMRSLALYLRTTR